MHLLGDSISGLLICPGGGRAPSTTDAPPAVGASVLAGCRDRHLRGLSARDYPLAGATNTASRPDSRPRRSRRPGAADACAQPGAALVQLVRSYCGVPCVLVRTVRGYAAPPLRHPQAAGAGCARSSFSNATGCAVITPSTHQSISFRHVAGLSPSSLEPLVPGVARACAVATFSGVVTSASAAELVGDRELERDDARPRRAAAEQERAAPSMPGATDLRARARGSGRPPAA